MPRTLLCLAAAAILGAAPAQAAAITSGHAPRGARQTHSRNHRVLRRHHPAPRDVATSAVPDPSVEVTAGPGLEGMPVTLPTAAYNVTTRGAATPALAAARRKASSVSQATALQTALATAPSGSVIHLAAGSYPQIVDAHRRSGWVTISGAGDGSAPVIAGAKLKGAQFLRFVDVKFNAHVEVSDSPYLGEAQPAEHIEILNSEIDCGSTTTRPSTSAINVRGASQDVTLDGDYVHNCVVGFSSTAQDPFSTDISITHSLFEDFPGDAIDLGGLSGVTIDHDVIRNMIDPTGAFHNDGIQFLGHVQHVQITDNVLANSRRQLIFIQDAVAGRASGSSVNQDILVDHNLIYGADAIAVQAQGAVDTRFIDNTMWDNGLGSLLLRSSGFSGIVPTDTVVLGNIIQGMGHQGMTPAVRAYNLIDNTGPNPVGDTSNDIRGIDPGFADPATGDFAPTAASPTFLLTPTTTPLEQGYLAAGVDMFGVGVGSRSDYGALQAGDPPTSYGAPAYGQITDS